ncbi:uncharacterized protein EI97DRAFT_437387 [Westerdykella ornata]|uniref:Uncharacterized protein n=1 Tax=Westerdykella ornata TaxID=318751 RepID=A0A6A6J647_WESOR|nr:uncharacterized protein EI97DRAFT_437387 [Westerdykella ornata]KAF2271905.1 hypothetical protein EI97DRAFT_437387 [Westerdykella ornata]
MGAWCRTHPSHPHPPAHLVSDIVSPFFLQPIHSLPFPYQRRTHSPPSKVLSPQHPVDYPFLSV